MCTTLAKIDTTPQAQEDGNPLCREERAVVHLQGVFSSSLCTKNHMCQFRTDSV